MKIIFTTLLSISEIYYPVPASKEIPDWYKDTPSYLDEGKVPSPTHYNGDTTATIKRCMPIFDSISAGYILKTSADVNVKQEKDENGNLFTRFDWASLDMISFHSTRQASLYPEDQETPYPKFTNHWGIKTPPGYSCLFQTPRHRDLPFKILEGIVDTDKYDAPVNFPFVLKDKNFTGMIPAGTPMAQVIPFKRDSWTMEIGSEKNKKDQIKTDALLKSKFFDRYKTLHRSKKEFN
jgi:hypothetical protein